MFVASSYCINSSLLYVSSLALEQCGSLPSLHCANIDMAMLLSSTIHNVMHYVNLYIKSVLPSLFW